MEDALAISLIIATVLFFTRGQSMSDKESTLSDAEKRFVGEDEQSKDQLRRFTEAGANTTLFTNATNKGERTGC